jgi:hypothetical protein
MLCAEQKIKDSEMDARRTYREQAMRDSFRNGLQSQLEGKKVQENISREQRLREIKLLEMNALSPKQVELLETLKKRESESRYKEDLDKIMFEKEQTHLRNIR